MYLVMLPVLAAKEHSKYSLPGFPSMLDEPDAGPSGKPESFPTNCSSGKSLLWEEQPYAGPSGEPGFLDFEPPSGPSFSGPSKQPEEPSYTGLGHNRDLKEPPSGPSSEPGFLDFEPSGQVSKPSGIPQDPPSYSLFGGPLGLSNIGSSTGPLEKPTRAETSLGKSTSAGSTEEPLCFNYPVCFWEGVSFVGSEKYCDVATSTPGR